MSHLAVAAYLGEPRESSALAVLLLAVAGTFVALSGRLPARVLELGAFGGMIAGTVAAQLVFPVGGDTIVYAVTMSMMILWEVPSTRRALAIVGLLYAVPGLVYVSGFGGGLVPAAPTWVTIAIGAGWGTLYATLTMDRARGAAAAARARLAETEARIGEEVASLRAQHAEQAETNARLDAEAAALAARLAVEQAATQRLRDAVGDREQLATAIRHDLREPLRSITSFSQLLRRRLARDLPGGKAGDYLAFAEDGGRRMAAMVDDLLRYTQSDHAEALEGVDLAGVLGEVRLNLADQIGRTGAIIVVEGALPTLWGYPTQVYQLVQNLVSNAIKFARPGVPPVITITPAGSTDDAAHVTFADNGRGIPAHQLQDVFGLFNRSGNAGEVEGTGVGLALCRRIAIAHGGALTVTSVAGEGTAFLFVCPRAAGGLAAASPARERPSTQALPV